MYNLYIENTNNLDKFKLYTTQHKFEFLVINSLPIFSSDDLKPTSSSSFAYIDKVILVRSKDLVLD